MEQEKCFLCSTTDVTPCSACDGKVAFCPLHYNMHRPAAIGKCLPFVSDRLENVGRILKASQLITKGQLAVFDKAFTLGKCFQVINKVEKKGQKSSAALQA